MSRSYEIASSSSSSEEEDESTCKIPRDQLEGIPCKNSQCDQELVLVRNKGEYYCSRECYHFKQEREKLGLFGKSKVEMKRVTIEGRGGTGLLRNPCLLDHLRIRVDENLGRSVMVQNSGANAIRWKASSVERDEMKKKKREKDKERKQQLKALLNVGSDDSSSSSSDAESGSEIAAAASAEEAHEEIQNMLSSGLESNICPLHEPLKEKRLKGFVINVISPWELYVQTEEMLMKTHEIDAICNRPIDPRLLLPHWLPRVGSHCIAKYEDKLYRAKILEKVDSRFRVKYVDYGNVDLVAETQVFQLSPELTLIPRQYIFFKVSNVKPVKNGNQWSAEICQFTQESLDGGIVDMEIESVEHRVIHWGKIKICSSINLGADAGDFGDLLVKKGMAESQQFFV